MILYNMKIMLSIISVIILVGLFTSCDKTMDLSPQGSVDAAALSNTAGVDLVVVAAYASLTESYYTGVINNWLTGSVYGGDANKGTDPGDQPYMDELELHGSLANNRIFNEKWIFCYNGIKCTNTAINQINNTPEIGDDLRNRRLGEMKFLRAHFYYDLRRHFHMVPFIDEILASTSNNILAKNDSDVLPNIEADLSGAIQLLPNIQDAVGRPNVWAAKAYLAKVYMFQGKFSEAVTLLKDIIDNGVNSKGVKYQLQTKYSDNFSIAMENSSETVFSVQHSTDAVGANANYDHMTNSLYGGALNFGGYGFFQPSYVFVNSFQVDVNGLPLLDGSYMDYVIPGTNILGASQVNDADRTIPVDPRLDHTVGRRGIPFYDWGFPKNNWVRNQSNGGDFMPKKNLPRSSDSQIVTRGSALNTDIIRFADVLLWYAEALAETGQLEAAREYVNMIRERAANDLVMFEGTPAANYKVSPYPASYFDTKEKSLEAIRFERKLEFGMEGIRFFDLQRWGFDLAKKELDFYTSKEKSYIVKYAGAVPFSEHMMYFPIPEAQIVSMHTDKNGDPYLTQNPGY